MKLQIDHTALASFHLWLDNVLTSENQGTGYYSGILYNINNPRNSDLNSYASPHAQWVYDQSVSGANIPTGVFINNSFNPKGTNGLKIDYNHGRVYFSSSQDNITAAFNYKEINTYITVKEDIDLLFETQWKSDSEYPIAKQGIPYDADIYPALYIKYYNSDNKPYALGGMDTTTFKYRGILITNSAYQLDSLIGILRDTQARCIPLFSAPDLPFNQFGDLKNDSFNYTGEATGNSKLHIESVIPSRLSEIVNKSIGRKVFGGYVDFECSIHRHPRA